MCQIPISPAADGSDDAQHRCLRFVAALMRAATAFRGDRLPAISRRRRFSVPGMECLNPGRLDRRPPRELFEGARLCNRVPSGHRAANPRSTA